MIKKFTVYYSHIGIFKMIRVVQPDDGEDSRKNDIKLKGFSADKVAVEDYRFLFDKKISSRLICSKYYVFTSSIRTCTLKTILIIISVILITTLQAESMHKDDHLILILFTCAA